MGKRWLFALVALGVLLGSGVVAATGLLRSSALKVRIEQAAYRATGRQLTIAGEVRPLWGFTPGIAVTDVSLANIAGGSRPQMGTVRRLEAHLALVPLLRGQVEITTATLIGPDILLERDAAGHPNWLFQPAQGAPGPSGPVSRPHRTAAGLDRLQLEQARVTEHGILPGQDLVFDVPKLNLDLASQPAELGFTAVVSGATFAGKLQADRRPAGAIPVRATLAGAGAAISLDAAYDGVTGTLTGQLGADVPDLATLAPLLPGPPPPLRALQVKATLAQAPLAWPVAQPLKLDAVGTLPTGPWHVGMTLLQSGQSLALRGLQVSSPLGDITGDVAFSTAPRPTLRGTLVSQRLDADALRPLLASFPAQPSPAQPSPAKSGPAAAASPSAPAAPPPKRVFSDAPLPWRLLRAADADLQLSIATLHLAGADYHNAAGHLGLADGALSLSPFSVTAPEGPVALSASADARPEPPPAALALRSGSVSIDTLLQAFGLPAGSSGGAQLDIALHAAGDTPHELAASLTGHVGVALVDGAIANADLAAALGGTLKSVGVGFDPGGQSAVRCLALRLNAQSGQVSLAALKLDTSRLLLTGSGTIDLASETLALQLRPLLRVGGAGVEAPLRIGGSLLHPAVAMASPAGELGRAGITIGGVAAPAEDCSAELAAARDGRPGPMPTAVAGKPVKPADLLRSLLR